MGCSGLTPDAELELRRELVAVVASPNTYIVSETRL
jgi:hypothetical protein